MLDILRTLVDTVLTLANLVISLVTGLINLIMNIPVYLNVLIGAINLLPPFVVPFATAFIMITVVQYVVGKRSE